MGSLIYLTGGHVVRSPEDPSRLLKRLEDHLEGGSPVMLIEPGNRAKGFLIPVEVSGVVSAGDVSEDFDLLVELGIALGCAHQRETVNTDTARQRAIGGLLNLEDRIGIENMPASAQRALDDLRGGRGEF